MVETRCSALCDCALATIGIGDALQLGEIGAAVAQFDLHGEAAGIADALDRRRRQTRDRAPSTRIERARSAGETARANLAALAPVLEHDIGDAGIGEHGTVVERRNAGDGDDVIDARVACARSSTPDPAPACVRSSEAPSGSCTADQQDSPDPRSAENRSARARAPSRPAPMMTKAMIAISAGMRRHARRSGRHSRARCGHRRR